MLSPPGGSDLRNNLTTDPEFLRADQYREADNLQARIELHTRFSTNAESWFPWLFERYRFPAQADILEIGCGPGDAWVRNLERVPAGWQLFLSDLSEGMVGKARQNLGQLPSRFCCLDAGWIPFTADSFDAVIGNHMLYHMPDLARALSDICRVLVPDGLLVSATNGAGHLAELYDLLEDFDPQYDRGDHQLSFTLESGAEILGRYFKKVERWDFPNDLQITEVEPLVAYTLSLWSINSDYFQERIDQYRAYLQEIIDRKGMIKINKSVGVFVSQGTKKD